MIDHVNILTQNLAVAIRARNAGQILSSLNQINRSKIAIAFAVYKTVKSSGSRTPGFKDSDRPMTQVDYNKLISRIWKIIKSPTTYKASPLSRIYIPKPDGRLRPISIPTYIDRSLQSFYNISLDVFQEEFADSKSFGFRKYRSPGWAAKSLLLSIWSRKGFNPPKRAMKLDITKCFDNISHQFIIDNVSKMFIDNTEIQIIPSSIMMSWLKQGFSDREGEFTDPLDIQPTELGVPQGGPISPTISNIVLNGIQDAVLFQSKSNNRVDINNSFTKLIRFADDCIVLFNDDSLIPEINKNLEIFLSERGLTLNPTKTQVIDLTTSPFLFLGYEFRIVLRHGKFSTYFYPPNRAIKKLLENLLLCFPRKHKYRWKKGKWKRLPIPFPQQAIQKANPILRGWLNYYRCSNASKHFSYIKYRIFHIVRKYLSFYMSRGNKYKNSKKQVLYTSLYQDMFKTYLLRHSLKGTEKWWAYTYKDKIKFLVHPKDHNIVTPTIIEGKSSYHPTDQLILLAKSMNWKWGFRGLIFKKHKGICKYCNLLLDESSFHLHHVLPVKYGGTYAIKNIVPLCIDCHKHVTNSVRNFDRIQIANYIDRGILDPSLLKILNIE